MISQAYLNGYMNKEALEWADVKKFYNENSRAVNTAGTGLLLGGLTSLITKASGASNKASLLTGLGVGVAGATAYYNKDAISKYIHKLLGTTAKGTKGGANRALIGADIEAESIIKKRFPMPLQDFNNNIQAATDTTVPYNSDNNAYVNILKKYKSTTDPEKKKKIRTLLNRVRRSGDAGNGYFYNNPRKRILRGF